MHRSRSVRRVEVATDGRNLVSHAGTALLCELADRTGLTRAMSVAMADCGISWNTHDPGVVLTHLVVAIADGGDCLSEFEVLRSQSELFGDVASISTAWRAVKATASLELRQIPKAVAGAREIVWAAATPGDITIDFDATFVTAFSDNQDARPRTRRASVFIPSAPGATRPGSRSGRYCVRATPARTTPRTTSSCWTRRSPSSRRSTR